MSLKYLYTYCTCEKVKHLEINNWIFSILYLFRNKIKQSINWLFRQIAQHYYTIRVSVINIISDNLCNICYSCMQPHLHVCLCVCVCLCVHMCVWDERECECMYVHKCLAFETVVSIDVPWGRISGKAWGSPSGRPVLSLHGMDWLYTVLNVL